MRKVVSSDEVAHLWANHHQEEARTSTGNFYFHGNTIYSYGSHFPIAVLKCEKQAVLFTTRTYSVTTSAHISMTRNACNHYEPVYCCNPDEASRGYHDNNLAAFERECKSLAGKLAKAKKPEIYLSQIAYQRELLNKYSAFFDLDLNTISVPLAYIYILSKNEGQEASEKERIAVEERNQKAEMQRKKDHAKELRKFRAFKLQRMYMRNGFDYLRYNAESKRVETSQGVEIPAEVARRFYKWVKATIKKGGCDGNCGEIKILDYTVKAVSKDMMQIGCHNIPIREADAIAVLLNW